MAKRKKKLSLFQVIQTHESDWYTELPAFGLWRSKHPRKFTNVLRVVTSIKEQPKYRQWSTYMVSPQCQLVPLVVPCLLSRLYIYIFTERLLQSLVVSLTKLSSPEMHLHHKKSSKCNLVAMLTRCGIFSWYSYCISSRTTFGDIKVGIKFMMFHFWFQKKKKKSGLHAARDEYRKALMRNG